uniref:Uncharacterized protein n=1 Tax=Bursaphelenchus xylophilus TaxID=6326 RepID=A0A1I7S308_BURXY
MTNYLTSCSGSYRYNNDHTFATPSDERFQETPGRSSSWSKWCPDGREHYGVGSHNFWASRHAIRGRYV